MRPARLSAGVRHREMLSRVRFLQLSALVPVALVLFCGLVHLLIVTLAGTVQGNTATGMILWFLLAVPFMGSFLLAPVYAIFAVVLLAILRRRPEHVYREAVPLWWTVADWRSSPGFLISEK